MKDFKNIKDLKSLVGNHPYKQYGPLERFYQKVDDIMRDRPMKEEDVIKSFKEMYHLCVAYLIGAEVNNAPTTPVYDVSEFFSQRPYNEWDTEDTLGNIIRKNDIMYKNYMNKTVYESARELFSFIDKKLLKENIEYLFPQKDL